MGAALGCFEHFNPQKYELTEKIYEEVAAKLPSLSGKAVAITGCTTGLGYYVALLAVRKGASKVLLLNRASDRASAAERALAEKAASGTQVTQVDCDLMNFASVREAAAKVQTLVGSQGLDVLALNAGVMALKDIRTEPGFDVQMHTNQLAHVLLVSLLMPLLESCAAAKGDARVVFHSSSARDISGKMLEAKYFEKSEPQTLGGDHTYMMMEVAGLCDGPWVRYHMTKLANSAYAMKLHEELQARGSKVRSMACDPGCAVTELQRTAIEKGNMTSMVASLSMSSTGQSAADGSTPLAMCCFSPDAESGDFYMPEKVMTGRPIKSISRGAPVKRRGEKLTTSKANQQLAWEKTHAALGISSFFQ